MNKMDDLIKIGALTVKNRLVKSATVESTATLYGDLTEAYYRFYARQAAG